MESIIKYTNKVIIGNCRFTLYKDRFSLGEVVYLTYIITRILESVEIPFLASISSLKILDWFLIVLVIGISMLDWITI